MVAQWQAGDDHALCWPGGLALLDGAVPVEAAACLWSALARPDACPLTLPRFLDLLAAHIGPDHADAAYAVLLTTPDHAVAGTRGGLTVAARTAHGEVELTGTGRDGYRLEAIRSVTLRRGSAHPDTQVRPLGSGLVPASRITLEFASTGPDDEGAPEDTLPELAPSAAPDIDTLDGLEPDGTATPPEPRDQRDDDQVSPRHAPGSDLADGFIADIPHAARSGPQAPTEVIPFAADHPNSAAEPGTERRFVVAVFCPARHPNPPQRLRCRICGEPVVGEPERIPQPAVGRLLASTGESFELTGTVVAGRAPRSRAGNVRLLALPYGHISSSHVEIRVSGWTVLALDLASRNGTYLRRGSLPPMRLPEVPVPLYAGDALDFGDGVRIGFEQLP